MRDRIYVIPPETEDLHAESLPRGMVVSLVPETGNTATAGPNP